MSRKQASELYTQLKGPLAVSSQGMALQECALALGNRGTCLLDEFCKVKNEDRYEIHFDVVLIEFNSPQYQILLSSSLDFPRVIILHGME
jgi:hypothetical protein